MIKRVERGKLERRKKCRKGWTGEGALVIGQCILNNR